MQYNYDVFKTLFKEKAMNDNRAHDKQNESGKADADIRRRRKGAIIAAAACAAAQYTQNRFYLSFFKLIPKCFR